MQCILEFYFHLIPRGCIIRIVIIEMLCYRTYNSNDSRKLRISSFRLLLAPGPCFQCCDCCCQQHLNSENWRMKSVCYRERRQSAISYPCIWPNITSTIKILLYLNKLLCLRINIFDILFTAFTMFYCVFHVLKLFAYIVDVDKLDLF